MHIKQLVNAIPSQVQRNFASYLKGINSGIMKKVTAPGEKRKKRSRKREKREMKKFVLQKKREAKTAARAPEAKKVNEEAEKENF